MVYLQSFTIGKELTHMLCVTMSQASCPQAIAGIVYSHRAIHHFIFAVAIQVSYTE